MYTPHPQRRAWPALAGVGVILGIILACGLVALFAAFWFDPTAVQERQRQAWRQAQIDAELTSIDMAVAAAWKVLPLLLIAGAGGVGMAVAWKRWGWTPAIQARYQVQLEAARHQPGQTPQSLTYSPHISVKNDRGADLPMLAAPSLPEIETVPTFAQLLASGEIGPRQPLILGYGETGRPIHGSWLDLYSTGIGGISGSGKTWTAVGLLAQSVMSGARVLALDPHAGDAESLTTRFDPLRSAYVCEPATDGRSALEMIKLVTAEIERRKHDPRAPRTPWIVVADEFSSWMRGDVAEPLARIYEAIAQEGRKYQIFGAALGQVWTVSRAGGSELRDSLASCYLHRLKPAQARHLSGLASDDLPDDMLELPAGTCYLLRTSGGELERLTIPKMTPADLVTVAGVISGRVPTEPVGRPLEPIGISAGTSHGFHIEASGASESSAPASAEVRSATEAHIIGLFLQGKDAAEIVRTVWPDVKPGRGVQEKSAQVQATIRQALQGIR